MGNIPFYVSATFLAVVLTTLFFLYYALNSADKDSSNITSSIVMTLVIGWAFVVSILSFNDFFLDFESFPPRFIFILLPPFLAIIILLLVKNSRKFLIKMPITTLTYVHIVRVPVEIVLWWLAFHGVVATDMTFEGMNYDIISGISAPFAAVFLVGLRSKSRIGSIIWNFLALGLVINIVTRAIMATPYFFDPEKFDFPNIAVFYFPYILLPAIVVPIVIFCHLISLVILFQKPDED